MGNKTGVWCWMAFWASALLGSCMAWGQGAPVDSARLLVVVYDDGHVDKGVVERAEKDAERVFRQAGVSVQWRNANWEQVGNRSSVEGSLRLDLHILPRARTLRDEVFGIAFVGENGVGQQADVFYEAIEKTNSHHAQDRAVLLGAVMAHELGHLLLGSHAHTATGIMLGNWDESALRLVATGMAGFNAEQGRAMRERIAGSRTTEPGAIDGSRKNGFASGLVAALQ